MKYFIDTELLEGTQTKRFLGIPFGKTPPTIDLISIAIVSEDGREYYAISKDFNLDEAWNRYDLKFSAKHQSGYEKEYWIRENVLEPIFKELQERELQEVGQNLVDFCYKDFKTLIKKYGKSREQIAEEIKEFIYKPYGKPNSINHIFNEVLLKENPINFYGYYSAYDHVALCWLFGKMIDLPKGFPMYTIDLKQELDNRVNEWRNTFEAPISFEEALQFNKESSNYPKHTNEHNALSDAHWNKRLYEFLQAI
jgi:hypothetical protein